MARHYGQGILLSLLDELGGRVSNLDFQKLLFLFCQEARQPLIYEFVPYRFGAFSFSSYADRRKLVERGLLANDEAAWSLTPQGRRAAQTYTATLAEIKAFARRYTRLRGEALVAETYRRFPYFAIRSEVAHRILSGDRIALDAVEAAKPLTRPGLSTIGYQGLNLEAYLNRIVQSGVTLLCDVRRNPLSRKYGFSKKTLGHACHGLGLRYEHLPELGIASEERRHLSSESDYQQLFARYERCTLRRETATLARISEWVHSGEHVALTCFEQRPNECHRLRVAWAVNDSLGKYPPAVHM